MMYQYRARVARVWDGDSVHFKVFSETDHGFNVRSCTEIDVKTRLLGVDTPELGQVGGIESRDYVRSLLPEGSEVTIQTFKYPGDKYGRWLAKVDVSNIGDLASAIIASGHGVPYYGTTR